MNKLSIIKEQEILGKVFRIYGTLEEPLFLAKDVAEWIDYAFKDSRNINRDVSKMLLTVDEDEKIKSSLKLGGEDYSHGGMRENIEMWFLTEAGLYEVLMQSRKPIAKQFKKQVKQILKEIRRNGYYMATNVNVAELNELKQQVNMLLEREKERIFAVPSPKDYVLRFFAENCEVRKNYHVANINFYFKYQLWCQRLGIEPIENRDEVIAIILENVEGASMGMWYFTYALFDVAWQDKTLYQRTLL